MERTIGNLPQQVILGPGEVRHFHDDLRPNPVKRSVRLALRCMIGQKGSAIAALGRRRRGPGRTDYLLCVQVGDMPRAMPVAVLEARKEADDPLTGMQQARGYADTLRYGPRWLWK
jgi:hypothetical protein